MLPFRFHPQRPCLLVIYPAIVAFGGFLKAMSPKVTIQRVVIPSFVFVFFFFFPLWGHTSRKWWSKNSSLGLHSLSHVLRLGHCSRSTVGLLLNEILCTLRLVNGNLFFFFGCLGQKMEYLRICGGAGLICGCMSETCVLPWVLVWSMCSHRCWANVRMLTSVLGWLTDGYIEIENSLKGKQWRKHRFSTESSRGCWRAKKDSRELSRRGQRGSFSLLVWGPLWKQWPRIVEHRSPHKLLFVGS